MKNLLSGLISLLIIIFMLFIHRNPKQLDINKYNNAIVIEKQHDPLIGYYMYIIHNDTIKLVRPYQTFYDKYNVNDTIK